MVMFLLLALNKSVEITKKVRKTAYLKTTLREPEKHVPDFA